MRQTRSFSQKPESVAAARRFALQSLGGLSADVLDAVELMVSELATNCIRHTGGSFDLAIVRGRGQVRIEVTDRAGGTPRMRSPGPEDPTGRGLQIVNMLSQDWGVEQRASAGKTVWFVVPSALAG
jgi:anti-sigma regulatory factor (Ser/Thr protein kinase)